MSDHRIGLTLYKLEQFLNGDMDEMIDALITADTAESLRHRAKNNYFRGKVCQLNKANI